MSSLVKILIVCLVVLLGVSCGESTNTQSNDQTAQVQPKNEIEPKETILYSVINDLNVRDEAGRKGKVIAKLSYGQRTLFLDEETDYKERIIMRGTERFDSWKKVRFSSGAGGAAIEGWVYGGGMQDESEMYKEIDDNLYERNLKNITRAELSKIIGMTLTLDYTFNGSVKYTKSGGAYVKHENFSVTGLPKDRSDELKHVNVSYSGQYFNGEATGLFVKNFVGYESESKVSVMFENGKCLWAEININGEGEEWQDKLEAPEMCNFQYVETTAHALKSKTLEN